MNFRLLSYCASRQLYRWTARRRSGENPRVRPAIGVKSAVGRSRHLLIAVTLLTALLSRVTSRASKRVSRRGLEGTQSSHPLNRKSGPESGGNARGVDPGTSNAAAAPQHKTRRPNHGVVAASGNAEASRSRDTNQLRLSIITRHGHENRVSTMERAHGRRGKETLGLDAAHRDAAAGAR